MKSQKRGNSRRHKPNVVYKKEVAEEQAAQRIRNWIGQNEMKSVLNRMTVRAA